MPREFELLLEERMDEVKRRFKKKKKKTLRRLFGFRERVDFYEEEESSFQDHDTTIPGHAIMAV